LAKQIKKESNLMQCLVYTHHYRIRRQRRIYRLVNLYHGTTAYLRAPAGSFGLAAPHVARIKAQLCIVPTCLTCDPLGRNPGGATDTDDLSRATVWRCDQGRVVVTIPADKLED